MVEGFRTVEGQTAWSRGGGENLDRGERRGEIPFFGIGWGGACAFEEAQRRVKEIRLGERSPRNVWQFVGNGLWTTRTGKKLQTGTGAAYKGAQWSLDHHSPRPPPPRLLRSEMFAFFVVLLLVASTAAPVVEACIPGLFGGNCCSTPSCPMPCGGAPYAAAYSAPAGAYQVGKK
ncbi:hypothetical protein QR680_009553 [Steinernema hermaphroditum]|uniref:Uncharacterized protein n=1 Tax=Steinernema hermaphroditum TaxID=289476 RepID=A0AA39IKS0_9BILA|nr:hypothetical protein QR680_009553 [Steinernema hermaphroditum]